MSDSPRQEKMLSTDSHSISNPITRDNALEDHGHTHMHTHGSNYGSTATPTCAAGAEAERTHDVEHDNNQERNRAVARARFGEKSVSDAEGSPEALRTLTNAVKDMQAKAKADANAEGDADSDLIVVFVSGRWQSCCRNSPEALGRECEVQGSGNAVQHVPVARGVAGDAGRHVHVLDCVPLALPRACALRHVSTAVRALLADGGGLFYGEEAGVDGWCRSTVEHYRQQVGPFTAAAGVATGGWAVHADRTTPRNNAGGFSLRRTVPAQGATAKANAKGAPAPHGASGADSKKHVHVHGEGEGERELFYNAGLDWLFARSASTGRFVPLELAPGPDAHETGFSLLDLGVAHGDHLEVGVARAGAGRREGPPQTQSAACGGAESESESLDPLRDQTRFVDLSAPYAESQDREWGWRLYAEEIFSTCAASFFLLLAIYANLPQACGPYCSLQALSDRCGCQNGADTDGTGDEWSTTCALLRGLAACMRCTVYGPTWPGDSAPWLPQTLRSVLELMKPDYLELLFCLLLSALVLLLWGCWLCLMASLLVPTTLIFEIIPDARR